MSEKKPLNEGYQPKKEDFGYQPSNKIEKGYQPQSTQAIDISNPPSGGSDVQQPQSSGDKK